MAKSSDHHTGKDPLFEHLRKAAPVLSLEQAKEILQGSARPSRFGNSQYLLGSLGLCIIIAIGYWEAQKPLHKTTIRIAQDSLNTPHLENAKHPTTLKKPKAQKAPQEIEQYVAKPSTPLAKEEPMPDSLNLPYAKQQPETPTTADTTQVLIHASKSPTLSSGIVIYQFSNIERLQYCRDKLAAVGIQMVVKELIYDKVYKNRITLLDIDLAHGNQIYKSLRISDFKELRIEWSLSPNGEATIKSLYLLDKNYILKPL